MPAVSSLASPSPAPLPADGTVKLTRVVAVATLLALVALGLAWELWLAPTGRGTLAIKVLPLVLALPGLLKYRMFTYRWLSLVLWLYVVEGSVRAVGDGGLSARLAGLEVGLCIVLFIACATHVRWRHQRAKAGAASP